MRRYTRGERQRWASNIVSVSGEKRTSYCGPSTILRFPRKWTQRDVECFLRYVPYVLFTYHLVSFISYALGIIEKKIVGSGLNG